MWDTVKLELLSVICIETSHYVCFTRDTEGRWLLFDSMANRLCECLEHSVSAPARTIGLMTLLFLSLTPDDQYYIPRGVDCTAQLNEWVYGGSTERLMATGPRDLPELVRRFTQDIYMCVYIQPDHGMYGDSGKRIILTVFLVWTKPTVCGTLFRRYSTDQQ